MPRLEIDLPTPQWALPMLRPARYKGIKGGRAGAKSHLVAELAVEEMVADPTLRFVCIREVQRSLRFSAKSLVEQKIRQMGVAHLFDILTTEIRRKGGPGIMIFEGMQDHTADSLKSLEGFQRAWVEEAQSISQRSLDLLLPTIRSPGSEIWFTWNPDQPDDPVDVLFQQLEEDDPEQARHVLIHANYTDNPWCPPEMVAEAERMRRVDIDAYAHIWLGQYNVKSQAQVLHGKCRVEDFAPQPGWQGPYHGNDHGFAQDPTTLVRVWIGPHPSHGKHCLYVERESYAVELSIDARATRWERDVPGFARYVVRADSAEPGTIDYLKRHGVPKIEGVKKWQGSVEDGIAHLRQYDAIIIHPNCPHAIEESRLYRYKVDKKTGDILPDIEDKHNHIWDAVRYALAPLIHKQGFDLVVG
jgi:phage terminase large subunit